MNVFNATECALKNSQNWGVPTVAQRVKNPNSIHEDVGTTVSRQELQILILLIACLGHFF